MLDPYLRSRAREQDPRIPLMAKPEKPNNEPSIGVPKEAMQGFRGRRRTIMNSG